MRGYLGSIFVLSAALNITMCIPFCNVSAVDSNESCCIPTCTTGDCLRFDPCPGSLFYTPLNMKFTCSLYGKVKNFSNHDGIGLSRFCSTQCQKGFRKFDNETVNVCMECGGFCETKTSLGGKISQAIQAVLSILAILVLALIIIILVIVARRRCKRTQDNGKNSLEASTTQANMDNQDKKKNITYKNIDEMSKSIAISQNSYVKDPTNRNQKSKDDSDYDYAENRMVPRSAFIGNETQSDLAEQDEEMYTNKAFNVNLNHGDDYETINVKHAESLKERHDDTKINKGVSSEPENIAVVDSIVDIQHAVNVKSEHCKIGIQNAEIVYINVQGTNENKNTKDDRDQKKTKSL